MMLFVIFGSNTSKSEGILNVGLEAILWFPKPDITALRVMPSFTAASVLEAETFMVTSPTIPEKSAGRGVGRGFTLMVKAFDFTLFLTVRDLSKKSPNIPGDWRAVS